MVLARRQRVSIEGHTRSSSRSRLARGAERARSRAIRDSEATASEHRGPHQIEQPITSGPRSGASAEPSNWFDSSSRRERHTVNSVFHLHDADDVAITRADIAAGDVIDDGIAARSAVPRGHKIATHAVAAGEPVHKYGQTIGFATKDIVPGDHVHSHNLEFRQFEREYAFGVDARPTAYIPEGERATFEGYVRSDGRVGTRNYIAVICSVNCSATAAKLIVDRFREPALAEYPGIDGVVALTHTLGCGTAGAGNYGFDLFRRTLTGYANHPNVVGVLALGLGCEVNQINDLINGGEMPPDRPLSWMTIQELGGTRKTVAEGESRIREMLTAQSGLKRQTVPASKLVLGMECGGSDGYSGITANPALGAAADLLVRNGGTAAFGETTEIYGAEHLL